jgi:hypothetical protein
MSLQTHLLTQTSQISVDSTAINDDLAEDVAKTLGREPNALVLELPGGFELRGEE